MIFLFEICWKTSRRSLQFHCSRSLYLFYLNPYLSLYPVVYPTHYSYRVALLGILFNWPHIFSDILGSCPHISLTYLDLDTSKLTPLLWLRGLIQSSIHHTPHILLVLVECLFTVMYSQYEYRYWYYTNTVLIIVLVVVRLPFLYLST